MSAKHALLGARLSLIIFLFLPILARSSQKDRLYELYLSTSVSPRYKPRLERLLHSRQQALSAKPHAARQNRKAAGPSSPSIPMSLFSLAKISVHPNPSQGAVPEISIEASLAERVELRVFSASGQLVDSADLNSLSEFVNGFSIYRYRLKPGLMLGKYRYSVQALRQGFLPLKAEGTFLIQPRWMP